MHATLLPLLLAAIPHATVSIAPLPAAQVPAPLQTDTALQLRDALRRHVAGRVANHSPDDRLLVRIELIQTLDAMTPVESAPMRALVRDVAAECRELGDMQTLWKALDTLWKSGEDRAYFTAIVDEHATQPMRAAAAMGVLARDPGDLVDRFQKIAEQATRADVPYASYLEVAAAEAACVSARSKQYDGVVGIEEKVAFLAKQAIGSYLPGVGPSYAPSELHDPIAEWARMELRELSKLDARRTADALARVELGHDPKPEVEAELHAWVARFL